MQNATELKNFPILLEGTPKGPQSIVSESSGLKHIGDYKKIMQLFMAEAIDITPESSSTLLMQSKISKLEEKVASLESKVAELDGCLAQEDAEVINIRDISYGQAKQEIRQYFKDHHGEEYTASDLEERLGIDFEMALVICSELEKEGQIG